MQDEHAATLALCDTPDCSHFGACHIECMPLAMRPPMQLPKHASSDEDDDDDDDDLDDDDDERPTGKQDVKEEEGATAPAPDGAATAPDGAGAPAGASAGAAGRKPAPPAPQWRPGDPKRVWELKQFHWYCADCAVADGAPSCPPCGVVSAVKKGAPPPRGKGGKKVAAGKGKEEEAAAGADGNGADGAQGGGGASAAPSVPVPRAELTWAHRRILKLYYDLCPKPDDTELTLLASLTERSTTAEVLQWFHERTLEMRRKERIKEEIAKKAAEEKAAKLNPPPLPPSASAPAALGGDAARHAASAFHAAGASATKAAQQQHLDQAFAERQSQLLLKTFDDLKQRGNQAFQAKSYELALQCYISAAQVLPMASYGFL